LRPEVCSPVLYPYAWSHGGGEMIVGEKVDDDNDDDDYEVEEVG